MAQNRTIGMAAFRSAVLASSPLRLLCKHHGAQRGAMCITSGFCSKMHCMALAWPFLVFRSNPDLRSIGEPVFSPLSAAHWLNLAEPANNSRKSIFPFITHCHKTWAYDAEPSSVGSGAVASSVLPEAGAEELAVASGGGVSGKAGSLRGMSTWLKVSMSLLSKD